MKLFFKDSQKSLGTNALWYLQYRKIIKTNVDMQLQYCI